MAHSVVKAIMTDWFYILSSIMVLCLLVIIIMCRVIAYVVPILTSKFRYLLASTAMKNDMCVPAISIDDLNYDSLA
jgi:hypothetical protein